MRNISSRGAGIYSLTSSINSNNSEFLEDSASRGGALYFVSNNPSKFNNCNFFSK